MKKYNGSILIFIILIFLNNLVFAQTKGKISGVVIDAVSSEPLPGVNIYLEGTTFGAAADMDGTYFIINIPSGKYTLIASMLGYKEVKIENVVVHSARTTRIDIKMEEAVLKGEEVVIIAQRPVIQKDVTGSEIVTEGEVLVQMPAVTNVKGFVSKQAGVEGLLVRGGSIDQTAVMIDGLVMIDPSTNNPYTGVPLSSVKEVTVIKGGFNAEYGNVRSGMISIKTKEGEKSRFHASLDFRLGLAHQKHFGPSMFSPTNYYMRPYFDPQVAFTGTQNWPAYMRNNYPTFVGWSQWAKTLKDTLMTPEDAQNLFAWTHTIEGYEPWGIKGADYFGQKLRTYGDKPDWNVDLSLSGPIPWIGKYLGDMTFFTSYKASRGYLAVPFVRDNTTTHDVQGKLISDLTDNMKLTMTGVYSKRIGVAADRYSDVTGEMMSSSKALYLANRDNAYYYWQGAYSPLDIERYMLGLTLEHALNKSAYYTIRAGYTEDRYFSNGYLSERDTTVRAVFGSTPVDETPWGWIREKMAAEAASPDKRAFSVNGGMIYDNTRGRNYNFKFDMVNQFNIYNQFKFGTEFFYTDLFVNRLRVKGDRTRVDVGNRPSDWKSREYNAYPWRGSAYFQDKIEIKGMIANIGVRFDYFHSNTTNYLVDPFSKYMSEPSEGTVNDSIPSRPSKGRLKISPRIGIAHPITDNAKLYFNYGHFYAYPSNDQLFAILRGKEQIIEKYGNPDADLPRTIAYELGVELNLWDMFLLQLSGYYKDITNQLSTVKYVGVNSNVRYKTVKNQNFEDIRGFELQLTKNRGEWIQGWLNFTYIIENGGDIGREYYYDDLAKSREEGYYDLASSISSPVARPYARASIDVISPEDFGPVWFNNHLFGDIRLSVLPTWKAGSYYSYDPTGKNIDPEFENNIQWPDYYRMDLRLTKTIRFSQGGSLALFLEVVNLFNTKNFSAGIHRAFSSSSDRIAYLESLHLPLYKKEAYRSAGLTPGNDRVGDLRSEDKPYINDPNLTHSMYGSPREIILGLRIYY